MPACGCRRSARHFSVRNRAMSIGLARRSLAETELRLNKNRDVLAAEVDALSRDLDIAGKGNWRQDCSMHASSRRQPRFSGFGRTSLPLSQGPCSSSSPRPAARPISSEPGRSFQRRLREAAFVPIITPSLAQLKTVLREHERRQAIVETA